MSNRASLEPECKGGFMTTTVEQLLDNMGKDRQIWTVTPDKTIFDAIKLMAEKKIGALPVVDNGNMVGIISERDCTRKAIVQDIPIKTTQVRRIMTEKIYKIQHDQNIQQCMALMTDLGIRHLPVFKDESLVGVVSIMDIIKDVLKEQKFTIERLEDYIYGY